MKNICIVFILSFASYNCSDSAMSPDIDNIKDISVEDIFNSDSYIQDVLDSGFEDVADIFSGADSLEETSLYDFGDGSLYEDVFDKDILIDDAYFEDTEVVRDVADASDEDVGPQLLPPFLELITPSPSQDTSVHIGGSAGGSTIFIFNNKNCSAKPIISLSSVIFNRGGTNLNVQEGSTTYFSAYVEDDDGNISSCSQYITYVHNDGRWWRITFFDDFKGFQSGEDPQCYSIPPQCIGEYLTGLYECPQEEVHSGLEQLNKCNWTILRQPNWMANEYGHGKNGTNGFSPMEVSVDTNLDNGVLILSANAYKWDGTKLNKRDLLPSEANCLSQSQQNWLLHEENNPDCRNIVKYDCVWNKNTLNCPILSGAVYSKYFTNYKQDGQSILKDRGFIQKFGRWEVKARIPKGMGSFPAHWLLPQTGSWPERGEIDIMEADRNAMASYQTYHTGYCEGSNSNTFYNNDNCYNEGGQRYHLALGGQLRSRTVPFSDNYHTYSVEWNSNKIDFYTDGILTISIKEGDKNYGIFTDYGRYTGQARAINIPTLDQFFIILNQTVHNDSYGKVDPLNFVPQKHYIDYVKSYNVCQIPSEFCQSGYYFDGNDGLCYPLNDSGFAKAYYSPCKLKRDLIPEQKPLDTNLYFKCTVPCPFGGWFDGSNCGIFNSPNSREVFFYPDNGSEIPNLYYVTDGSEDGNCYDYIDSKKIPVGHYDGANCYLDRTLNELHGKYFRWGDPIPTSFYYQPLCNF